jgi:uncharacterized membrane protein YfcA
LRGAPGGLIGRTMLISIAAGGLVGGVAGGLFGSILPLLLYYGGLPPLAPAKTTSSLAVQQTSLTMTLPSQPLTASAHLASPACLFSAGTERMARGSTS